MYQSAVLVGCSSLVILTIGLMSLPPYHEISGLNMDVKCALYKNGDVDVRVYVMGLKSNTHHVVKIIPDHNPPTSTIANTDSYGILWVVSKVTGGEISLLFNVKVYQGNSTSGQIVASGSDDAPCYGLST